MSRKRAGFAGLIVLIIWLVAACGATSSLSSAVRSAASGVTGTRTSAPTSAPAATSAAATTAPSRTSRSPASSAASSQRATSTSSAAVVPAQPSVTPGATATSSPASSSTSPWLWFWIAVAIVALIGLVTWISTARHRRTRSATDWQSQVIDANAKGAAPHDAMAAAEAPGALAAGDAVLRWSDIQRRADDYSQLLYGMQQTAPTDQERLTISGVLASLQAARSAMEAERANGIPDASMSGLVRDRLSFFATTLGTLRQPQVRPV